MPQSESVIKKNDNENFNKGEKIASKDFNKEKINNMIEEYNDSREKRLGFFGFLIGFPKFVGFFLIKPTLNLKFLDF